MVDKKELKRNDLLYPELSYQIIGILFEVYNKMGYGYQEKYYQKAISEKLKEINLPFREQFVVEITFNNNEIGKYFLDFIIENKIILEIKRMDKFFKKDIEQAYAYLKATNLKLGILANFTKRGLQFKRIVNLNS
ncbi:MAG: GxxExxY protein [Candidatus Staskawiczbacteria bacterium]|nr:GxxExxY protein [Candidatus Staskawiczbacteria bacterium]MBI3337431.1 GxxExxY protein [Candidatus Staskawiczbacteria bacterium]